MEETAHPSGMTMVNILDEFFRTMPEIIVIAPAYDGKSCMLFWQTITSQMNPYESNCLRLIDTTRDHVMLSQKESNIEVKRIDCADRIIPDKPWKILNLHDPEFFKELCIIIRNL